MTYQEFARIFKLKTEALLYQEQIDLGISICKILYFDYLIFYAKNNWGNADLLIDTIDFKFQEDANLKQYEIDNNWDMIAARTFLLGVNRLWHTTCVLALCRGNKGVCAVGILLNFSTLAVGKQNLRPNQQ